MKFNYIYGKQAEQYDYLYIPKAFMKEEPFKTMTASAKILSTVLTTASMTGRISI